MILLQEGEDMIQTVILHQEEGMLQMQIHHPGEEGMIQMLHLQDDRTLIIHHQEERVVGTNLHQSSLTQMCPHQEKGLKAVILTTLLPEQGRKAVILTFHLQGKEETLIQTFPHQECRRHWMERKLVSRMQWTLKMN